MTEPAAENPAANPLSFEAAMQRLTEIVQTLERGDLPLEDSLRLFEEGVRLSRISQEHLDAAQKKVETLLAVDESGRTRRAPFETSAEARGERDDAR